MQDAISELNRQGLRPITRVLIPIIAAAGFAATSPPLHAEYAGVEVVGYQTSGNVSTPIGSWRWDTTYEEWEWYSAGGFGEPSTGGVTDELACAAGQQDWEAHNCDNNYRSPAVNGCGAAGAWITNIAIELSGFSQYEGISFANPCNTHDTCYGVGSNRESCDAGLGEDIRGLCNEASAFQSFVGICGDIAPEGRSPPYSTTTECAVEHRYQCSSLGTAFEGVVGALGDTAYNAAALSRACFSANSVRNNHGCNY